jgi:PAS domain S-box-containing protein
MQSRSTSFASLHAWRKRFYRLWYRVVTPLNPSKDVDQLRRARTLGTIVLVALSLMVFILFWPFLNPPMHLPVVISLIIVMAILPLNRAGHFNLGAILLIGVFSLLTYSAPILIFPRYLTSDNASLIWLTLPIIVAYLLFRLPGLLLTIAINLIVLPLIPLLLPELQTNKYFFDIFFIAVTSILIAVAGLLRQHDLRELANQSAQLQEERERYRDLFNAGFETLVVHKDGVVLDVNPAAEEMFGYTRQELLGRHILDFVLPESRDVVSQHYSTGSAEMYEARCERQDGSVIWVEIRGKPHQYRGQTVRVATVRDITQKREVEAQKLELTIEREKVRVLQRFIGDMSHDLRTPLSVMKTASYLIHRLSNQPEKMLPQVETLENQINHLQALFDDLLSMSRLDRADTSEYQFRWMSPVDLVEDVVEEQNKLALRKNITLTFQAEQPLSAVLLDENEFRRMLKHLIMNGVNYTHEGGQVQVRLCQREAWVCLEVSDNGPGIPSLDLPLIFERFYRGDKARSKETGGTGIGLSIVKKIVEAHNGQIEATSEQGKGATFCVRLPAQMTSFAEAVAPKPHTASD